MAMLVWSLVSPRTFPWVPEKQEGLSMERYILALGVSLSATILSAKNVFVGSRLRRGFCLITLIYSGYLASHFIHWFLLGLA